MRPAELSVPKLQRSTRFHRTTRRIVLTSLTFCPMREGDGALCYKNGPFVSSGLYGYARVSTDGQSVAAQVAALRKHAAGKVFREVASGAKTDRTQLRRVLDELDAGDVLMVTRLDRLARSTRDLLNTLAAITGKKAGFKSIGDTWADTTTAHGRLMLTVLGGLAEFERDLIRARTGEGRERAKARGVKLGRKPKLTEHQKGEAIRRRDHDGEPVREIARSYNVSHSTVSRLRA
jgi:DNA invertase Pin-like site-specific DNA recombinase